MGGKNTYLHWTFVRLKYYPYFLNFMKCRTTIKLKIPKKSQLLKLFESYKLACQYSADKAFEHKCTHKFELHNLIYYKLRKKFDLKSQFVINAIAKGFEAYKSCKKKIVFKQVSVRFDRRTFTFFSDKISLSTLDKRIIIPIDVPVYYWKYLDWNYQTADLCIIKNKMFINITFSREVNTYNVGSSTVGVDLGVNNLAVTSDGKVFTGYKTKIIQFQYLRKKLQAKGTKSAKRLLRKISSRQKRYMAWTNHKISKEIVSSADTIVLEDLKGIRKIKKGKRFNRWLHSWSFYQLQNFIKYKAEVQGKKVIFVNPYMTSQTCSNCQKIGSRYFDSFYCSHCGFSSQSDFNASCNLRRLSVTQPNISMNDVKGQSTTETDIRDKSPLL